MKPVAGVGLVALAISTMSPCAAQTPEQFYKGKQIELAIGYPPAGSNDIYARLLARHLGKHIPGNPTIVPQNRPGRIDSLINIVFTWHTSPVKTVADAFKTEAKLSGTGVGSTVSIYPTVMNQVLGTKFKLIMGYKGSNDAQLAVERGEVEGHSTSWTAVKVAHPDWRPDKKINVIVQFSLKKHPELQDVPTVVELARNDEERQVLSAVVNAAEIGTSFFTAPGVPKDRVEALRRAFDATMKDPEFLAEAERIKLTVGPLPGEELQKLVADVAAISPAILEKVRAAYATQK